MTRLIEILISLAIVATLYLVVGLILPSSRHLVEKVETNRKMTIVYDTLNSFRRFDDWNALVLHDPKMQVTLSGPVEGVGARLDYASQVDGVGKGSWEITQSVPGKLIAMTIDNEDRGHDKRTSFRLKPTGHNNRNVAITQTYNVDYGWNLIGRFAGLYVTRQVGDDMKLGLSRLVTMLATVPNIDYSARGTTMSTPKIVDRPAESVLYVRAGAVDKGNAQIQASITANAEWIKRVMDANGLEPVGSVRIVTTELSSQTYNFDVVQPVRKKDGGAVGNVTTQGPVKFEQVPAGRAVMASYTGYMAELENVRKSIRAWAATHGYEVKDRAYEDYKAGVAPSFTENGKFDAYWPVK